ncbi:MAG: phage DNA packaging protein J [Geothrix sp.]|nr:phage DNA packaging protein J [Geothrix sp.]
MAQTGARPGRPRPLGGSSEG